MQIIIDDWYDFILVGVVIISSLLIVYLIVKLILNNGGVKMKNFNLGKSNFPCVEHTKILSELKDTLIKMNEERSEASKLNQKLFKNILTSQDAIIEALQSAKIGNGHLEDARKLISTSFDLKDNYLINQL